MYNMKLSKDKKILIVGLGLLGGSYARGFTERGFHVGAITRSQSTIDYALQNKIISAGTTQIDPDFIGEYDVIIFALYPKVFVKWIEDNQQHIKPNAVLTDVTGIKCAIVYKIQDILRDDLEFVPAHPMAGRESSGVVNSTSAIFNGANYIVTPTDKNTDGNIELVSSIGEILGFRKISLLTPEKHDEMIAFLSQLTHCIAVSLMDCKDSTDLVNFTGDSFRDLTRIAKINENMWTELFIMNKEQLLAQMDLFLTNFVKLRNAIENEDKETMKQMMITSTKRRNFFDVR